MHKEKLFIVQIILLCFFMMESQADDWTKWRGPTRNGISKETGWDPYALADGAKILWKTNIGGGYSSITVQGNNLYSMGNVNDKDFVRCLNVETGEKIWQFNYNYEVKGFQGPFSTPVIDGNRIYTISRKGHLYCLNKKTGSKIWFKDITKGTGIIKPKYGFSGSPVIEDDLLILNAGGHGLALDKITGKKIWTSPSGCGGYATPVLYEYKGEKCLVIYSHKSVHGVNIRTGAELWYFPWKFPDGASSPDPVVIGSRVFIASAYRNGGKVIDFTNNDTKEIWYDKKMLNEFGTSIYLDGYLYVPVGDTRYTTSYLNCIKFETGEEMWTRDTGHCSLICVDGKFIVLNQWGELYIMKCSNNGWEDLSRAKICETSKTVRCWTAPVFSNGRIYVRNSAGDLICVDMSKKRQLLKGEK